MLRARQFGVRRLHCPYVECQRRRKLLIKNVRDHLIRHGRQPESRVWTGAGTRDSSDDEWEEHFWGPNENRCIRMDAKVNTRGMIHNAFAVEDKYIVGMEGQIWMEVVQTFMAANDVHEQCDVSFVHDDAHSAEVQEEDPNVGADADNVDLREDEPTATASEGRNREYVHFDPTDMEEALQELYSSSRFTKLEATILLMNLCTVHRVSKNCANELFTLLHGHILLENNSLSKNFHAA